MRTAMVWCPDWPVVAAARATGCSPDGPVAVVDKGRVLACSAAARESGVRRELRVREAQARCPTLQVLAYDTAVDARVFEPVVATVEELAPGVEILRPGMCAVGARGPSRYFGSEEAFAERLLDHLEVAGWHAVVGIADGPFAAEQAARLGTVFPPGASARCLAPLPITTLERPELVDLLRRLGVRTLGAFAKLPAARVLERFGTDGLLAHQLASGRESRPLAARRPPPELATTVALEPPVDRVDQVAFAARSAADRLVAGLAERDLVCTCLRVEVETDDGELHAREWRHPRWFTAADVVDRVRWQLQAGATAPVVRVRMAPEGVGRTGGFADGLWGDQVPDEQVHRALTRVQSMLGQEAVLTAVLSGGRSPAERVTLVPWGDEPVADRPSGPPWPGALPAPAPTTVLPVPEPIELVDAGGRPVGPEELAAGCRMRSRERTVEILRHAGPWWVDERWWDPTAARSYARVQVVCDDGLARSMVHEQWRWTVEGVYD